jgi:cation diffusion facilitator CzcD-associated flavoprotein CzcO
MKLASLARPQRLRFEAIQRCLVRRASVATMASGVEEVACDYLIVGCGASGMSFLDSLLTHHHAAESLSVVVVDKHSKPGGHWNDSYPFVTLHQSCANYGVESTPMEDSVRTQSYALPDWRSWSTTKS